MATVGRISPCTRQALRFITQRTFSSSLAVRSNNELSIPASIPSATGYPEHITSLVSKISQLTLAEVADLNRCLKEKLNIQDTPMIGMGMPIANMPQTAPQQEEEEVEAPQVQSLFSVKLEKFDEGKKIALIKEVKKLLEGMNLVQVQIPVVTQPLLTSIGTEISKWRELEIAYENNSELDKERDPREMDEQLVLLLK